MGLLWIAALICAVLCVFRAYLARHDDDHMLIWAVLAILFCFVFFITFLLWLAGGKEFI